MGKLRKLKGGLRAGRPAGFLLVRMGGGGTWRGEFG
jgi:hypothetical protein